MPLLFAFCVARREVEVDEPPRPTSNKATLDVGGNPKGFSAKSGAQRDKLSLLSNLMWRVVELIRASIAVKARARRPARLIDRSKAGREQGSGDTARTDLPFYSLGKL
jgi:hypothetical protein